jgi:acyl-CoA dehydrogenase
MRPSELAKSLHLTRITDLMAQSASFCTNVAGPIRSPIAIDKLSAYLESELNVKLIDVLQFAHGQSNPTYLLHVQVRAAETQQWVLRKQPSGRILASAHDVAREHRQYQSLHQTQVPVPRPLLLCEDCKVIGTPFYIMEFVKGRIFLDPNLPELQEQQRLKVYANAASSLARLHKIRVEKATSGGSMDGYCRRQVSRWTKQYHSSLSDGSVIMPEMAFLASWLSEHIPLEDPSHAVICHGDFRIDNLIIDPESLEIKAIVDWELSSIGSSGFADLAYSCLAYHIPPGFVGLPSFQQPLPPGIPSESEYVKWYCKEAAIDPPCSQDWSFYLSLSLFRLASILAGVQARSKAGNASNKNASKLATDENIRALATTALKIIFSASMPPMVLKSERLLRQLTQFMQDHVFPAESILDAHASGSDRWTIHPLMEELKEKAKHAGLWNLWLPESLASKLTHLQTPNSDENRWLLGPGLTTFEYGALCEATGRSPWGPEVFNCSAPDTGNMEVLAKYGSESQQREWLLPLLRGDIRSCFAMTEPEVASSDATNIQSSIVLSDDGSEYLVSGRKWWTSGAMDPRCKICIFMGKNNHKAAAHKQQSMVLVPMDSRGVTIVRPLLVYGFDDAPHGHAEVLFDKVRIPSANLILGEGKGFEIAQGRLGPGRLHHCLRLIGMAERSIELMSIRALSRRVFGGRIADQGAFKAELAKCRIDIESARLVVMNAAKELDERGFKGAAGAIAAAKVLAPVAALRVIDAAVQVHGGGGVCQDFILSRLWSGARTLRIADGPDEVHLGTIAKIELKKHSSKL